MCAVRVVVRELERCAEEWQEAADEVSALVGVLEDLDPRALGSEAEAAAAEFVAAVCWWVEHLAVLARAQAAALRAHAVDVAGTDRSVVLRFGGGGASW